MWVIRPNTLEDYLTWLASLVAAGAPTTVPLRCSWKLHEELMTSRSCYLVGYLSSSSYSTLPFNFSLFGISLLIALIIKLLTWHLTYLKESIFRCLFLKRIGLSDEVEFLLPWPEGAPTALVSLVGHKQYRRCARDIYYFSQVISIFSFFCKTGSAITSIHKLQFVCWLLGPFLSTYSFPSNTVLLPIFSLRSVWNNLLMVSWSSYWYRFSLSCGTSSWTFARKRLLKHLEKTAEQSEILQPAITLTRLQANVSVLQGQAPIYRLPSEHGSVSPEPLGCFGKRRGLTSNGFRLYTAIWYVTC